MSYDVLAWLASIATLLLYRAVCSRDIAPGIRCRHQRWVPSEVYGLSFRNMSYGSNGPYSLDEIVREVEATGNRVAIERHGRAVATMLPQEEYESLAESLNILSDERVMHSLREAESDLAAGRVEDLK